MMVFFQFIHKILGTIVYLFSWCFPRSRRIWVFGAWYGNNYSDNSKYFFEYVNSTEKKEITAIWLTKNTDVIESLDSKGYKAFHVNSLKGIYYSLRAKYGVLSSGNYDINPYLTGNMFLIQLWHGIPLKKIMYDDKINQNETGYSRVLNLIFPYRHRKYSMLIASSEEVREKMAQSFRVEKRIVKITGFPRNEAFNMKTTHYPLLKELNDHKKEGKSIGIYLPTFRDENPDQFINEIIESFNEIDNKLESINCIIYVKMHYMHLSSLAEKNIIFRNFRIIQDSEVKSDIYPLLPLSDFLITDYSSIYFDYLLLRKPMIFFPFDMETYISKSRELYYKYEDVTPGIKAMNSPELFEAIRDTLNLHDNFIDAREKTRKEFHEVIDGNYSDRLFNEILQLNSHR